MGIEPTAQAWEAWVLPLYDARYGVDSNHVSGSRANCATGGLGGDGSRRAAPTNELTP